ncbi:MAG: lytic transglycosylase domain-containing protein [Acidobacteriia bacterium]|nr:lytic transglycosylase domain-containing protein [Terriglobia bacterium]
MLALKWSFLNRRGNIRVKKCFTMTLGMPALMAAAGPSSMPPKVMTIVRADHSGRLVRSMRVQATEPEMATAELIRLIDSIAVEHGVEDSLVHSVIRAESNYNARAVSPKGAMGMMQLIPATARRFGVNNPFDVRENVHGGVRYLRFLLDYYKDNYPRAIAAYNAGEGAVDRYHGIPPYVETQNYVFRVANNLKAARARHKAAPEAALPAQRLENEAHQAIRALVGVDGKVYYRTE